MAIRSGLNLISRNEGYNSCAQLDNRFDSVWAT